MKAGCGLPRRFHRLAMTRLVRSVLISFVAFGVALNFSACGGILNENSANLANSGAKNSSTANSRKLIIKENPANDIVGHLRTLEKYKEIHEITEDEMYRVPTSANFGCKVVSCAKPSMEALELMLKHRDDIIIALREVGYNQAQIMGAYQGAFYEYGRTCELALGGDYVSSIVTQALPYCETYKAEFADTIAKCRVAKDYATQKRCGSPHGYTQNEIPKLVAGIYNKPLGVDDYHEAQARLKKLSDEDLGIPKERKAKLDEMVENLSTAELAGVVARLDTAISELRVSGLTQEQSSVVLTDVFFRYANECERAKNAMNSACDRYYKEFARQMSQKDGHRDYLKYARSVIPAKVVLAYTGDINKDRQRIESQKREFGGQKGISQRANDEGGISWAQVFEVVAQLAKIAEFALKLM